MVVNISAGEHVYARIGDHMCMHVRMYVQCFEVHKLQAGVSMGVCRCMTASWVCVCVGLCMFVWKVPACEHKQALMTFFVPT